MGLRSQEERDRERREYHADVGYAVWRSGGDMDRVNYDRVDDSYYDGQSSDSVASGELRRQMPRQPEEEEPQHDNRPDGGE